MPNAVDIIRTGVGNIASVRAAFARLGIESRMIDDAARVTNARLLVLPGVGAFAAGMSSLQQRGLVDSLRRRIEQNKPTLAICLGLQLLCQASTESPGVSGFGIIRETIERFERVQPVPQIGWNEVEPQTDSRYMTRGFAYFSNSYRLASVSPSSGWKCAYTDFGQPFVSALERGSVLACQFHPELSGAWGLALLKSWAATESAGVMC
jgi:imidazole glycerol-phosphate synthase subunit HisH